MHSHKHQLFKFILLVACFISTTFGDMIEVQSYAHEITQSMTGGSPGFEPPVDYHFSDSYSGSGTGATITSPPYVSPTSFPGDLFTEITPFSLTNLADPDMGNYDARSEASASWIFSPTSTLLEFNVTEENNSGMGFGNYSATQEWVIQDLTTSTILAQNSNSWSTPLPSSNYSASTDYSFTVDPLHDYQLTFLSNLYAMEDAYTYSITTVTFPTTSVPECDFFIMFFMGILLLLIFRKKIILI